MSGFLGSGSVYVNRKVGAVYQGYKLIGNATKFEIKENSEKKERVSKQASNYGSALNTVYVKKPAEVNITLDDLDKDTLALVFLGETSEVSVSGSTVTDEVVTAYKDHIFVTAKRNISSVVITDSAGTTTYDVTDDYIIVDADAGLIKIVETGDITDGQSLKVDYTYGAVTSDKVSGGTDSNIIMKVMLVGVNQADQTNVIANVFEAVLSPTSGVDFLSDDFTVLELAGIANVPTGGTSAYEVELNVAYA
jgi:hypothetical protein